MVWNSDAAEKKDEKLSFLNATTNIELKTNFRDIISKNKTDSDYKLYYICYQQPMSAKNANNICLFQKSKLSK